MSRRAKLIILALFLVLLAIPAAYVAFTWHPSSPLRFRLVHLYPEDHVDDKGFRLLRIRIENPNPVPVHVFFVHLRYPGGAPGVVWDPPGTIDPQFQREVAVPIRYDDFTLPPNSAILTTATLAPQLVEEARSGDIMARYFFMSHTYYQASMVYFWLRDHSPLSWQKYYPESDCPSDNVPVDVALE